MFLFLNTDNFCGCSVQGRLVKIVSKLTRILDKIHPLSQEIICISEKNFNCFTLMQSLKITSNACICMILLYLANEILLISLSIFLCYKQCLKLVLLCKTVV